MRRKEIIGLLFPLFLLLMSVSYRTEAQATLFDNAKLALAQANPTELSKMFNEKVEISFEGDSKIYPKVQAEFVMKDFFRKYPPTGFEYIHKGASKEQGLKFAIGKYTHAGGSFRVYILIKLVKDSYVIDTLDFSEE